MLRLQKNGDPSIVLYVVVTRSNNHDDVKVNLDHW